MNAQELKNQHMTRLINRAIRHWKAKGFSNEEIAEEIDKMSDNLLSMPKRQFLAMMRNYDSIAKKEAPDEDVEANKKGGEETSKTEVKEVYSIFDVVKNITEGGYGGALIEKETDKILAEYVDPSDYPDLEFSFSHGGKDTTGKYFIIPHSGQLEGEEYYSQQKNTEANNKKRIARGNGV